MLAAGCSTGEAPTYATLVRFEGAPPEPSTAVVRLLVVDLAGAERSGWKSPAGTSSAYEQLRALGLALQRYKPDTLVVRGLPEEAEVGGAASAAELLAASAELYYRAEVPEAARLCFGAWWDGRWWPRQCASETMVASLRTVAVAADSAVLGEGAGSVRLALSGAAKGELSAAAGQAPVVDAERWRVLRSAEDRFDGLLAVPARFFEVARVAPSGSGE